MNLGALQAIARMGHPLGKMTVQFQVYYQSLTIDTGTCI